MFKRSEIGFYILGKKYQFNLKTELEFVRQSQYWPDHAVKEYQLAHVRRIIFHACANVPYYQRAFARLKIEPDGITSLKDLERIPIIGKKEVKKNFDEFLAKNFRQYKPLDRYTGGTTGVAFHYYNDLKSWALNWATKIRAFEWGHYSFGDDCIGEMAGGSLIPKGKRGFKSKLWKYLHNYYPMPIMHMDDRIMESYYWGMKKRKIEFLRGYPSAIYSFAKFLIKNGKTIPLTSVFTTAEMLHDDQRKLLEEAFRCQVFDTYGCGDGMGGANECDHHEGLHCTFETNVMNIVDTNGREVSPGQEGEIVLTSFFDRAMPLIRYAPGDLAIKADGPCSCGRNLPLIKKIIGRMTDVIELSNGRILNGLSIPFEIWSRFIDKFQIIQQTMDHIEIKVIKKTAFTEKEEKQIYEVMRSHVGPGIKISITYVSEIPLPPSGKFRYVISNVSNI